MKNESCHKTSLFVFSRWAQKSYAVFASLGKRVRIGRLAVVISQVLGAKAHDCGNHADGVMNVDFFNTDEWPGLWDEMTNDRGVAILSRDRKQFHVVEFAELLFPGYRREDDFFYFDY